MVVAVEPHRRQLPTPDTARVDGKQVRQYDQAQRADECVELASLERWREEIISREKQAAAARPKSAIDVLRNKLEAAVAAEEFEEAARLRDAIRSLQERPEE